MRKGEYSMNDCTLDSTSHTLHDERIAELTDQVKKLEEKIDTWKRATEPIPRKLADRLILQEEEIEKLTKTVSYLRDKINHIRANITHHILKSHPDQVKP